MSDPTNQNYDHAVRIALLEQTTKGIKDELTKLNGHIGKLVWAVVTALVLAIMQFALKGGFSA